MDVKVMGTDIIRVLSNSNPSQKIKAVAKKHRTSGIWFSWGPAHFNQLWINACQNGTLMEHSIGIPKAIDNLVGPGLYVAAEMFRSSVYAGAGANVLVVRLVDVPTIDVRLPLQIGELGDPVPPQLGLDDLKTEKVHPVNIPILARYFYIFSTQGSFGCLTAHKGVTISLDLGIVPTNILLAQARRVGMEAAQPLLDQVTNFSPTLDPTILETLGRILRAKIPKK
jgi:hypothetical protein